MAELGELLRQCRKYLGSPPRELGAKEHNYFRLRPSLLMRIAFRLSRDKLGLILRDQHLLRDYGRVVWGCLVQANQVLFDPANRQMLPANVIYSPDTYFDDQLRFLQNVAGELFDLKGSSPHDDELESFARAITNEMTRIMRLALPPSLTRDRKVFFTTCLIQPSHLPGGCLASGFFPLLICPKKTKAVMILPERYWPDELCDVWMSAED